jgi:hypothetical protein
LVDLPFSTVSGEFGDVTSTAQTMADRSSPR